MRVDQIINVLATVTLIEMMIAIGLGVTLSDVFTVTEDWGLVVRAAVANYILFPGAAVALLRSFDVNPVVSAGCLVAAMCPGAPYGPPFTNLAKGNVTLAVGLMVFLAASSAIVAPVLLGLLLPSVTGDITLKLNVSKMLISLLGVQLLPLCVGFCIRRIHSSLADRLTKSANILSLNLATLTLILAGQFPILAQIRLKGYFGMFCLLSAGLAAGRLMGGPVGPNAKTMVHTTSVRNVGVSLVIVTASLAAITSTTAYAIFQTVAIGLVALVWGRLTPDWNLEKQPVT